MDPSIISHLIGPGTVKVTFKVVDHIVPGSTSAVVDSIERFQRSPVYMKHRVEQAQDFWDDHKDEVNDFIDNVGDTISDTVHTIAEHADDALEAIGDFLTSIF